MSERADASYIHDASRHFRGLFALVLILEGRYIKAYHSEDEHERLLVWACCLTCWVAAWSTYCLDGARRSGCSRSTQW
jgi:hypothetical protein